MKCDTLVERVKKISTWKKFYIGKWESVEMIAVRSVTEDPAKFAACVKKVMENSDFPLIHCSFNPAVLKAGLEVAAKARPLLYAANKDNCKEVAQLAFDYIVPVTLSVPFDLDALKSMVVTFAGMGLTDLILDPGTSPNGKKLQESMLKFIKLRRAAVEEALRDIAYPVMALPINAWMTTEDPVRAAYWESVLTAAFVIRGGAIMIKHSLEAYSMMPDMHLRFNIFTDPRKPVQVKPGIYKVAFARRLEGTAAARGQAHPDVPTALGAAFAQARPGDRILVFGSFHTAAAALQWLQVDANLQARR